MIPFQSIDSLPRNRSRSYRVILLAISAVRSIQRQIYITDGGGPSCKVAHYDSDRTYNLFLLIIDTCQNTNAGTTTAPQQLTVSNAVINEDHSPHSALPRLRALLSSPMTTAFLYLFTSPSSSQERSHISQDHGDRDRNRFPESISKLTARKAGGKQSAPKRPPQRGLGIAQLERLRIQESRMKLTDGEFQRPTYTASPNVYVDGGRWNDLKAPRHGLGFALFDHPRPQESFNQITDREVALPSYAIPSYTNVGGSGWHDLPSGSASYGYQRWRTLSHVMTPFVPASAIRSEFLDYRAVDRSLMTGGDTRFSAACPPIVEPPSNQMPHLGNCEFLALYSKKKRRLSGDQEFDTANAGHVATREESVAPYYMFFPPIVRSAGDSEIADQTVDVASPSTSSPNLVDLSLKLG
ncbi:putative SPEAR family protein [Dioscorea sansibarensis]